MTLVRGCAGWARSLGQLTPDNNQQYIQVHTIYYHQLAATIYFHQVNAANTGGYNVFTFFPVSVCLCANGLTLQDTDPSWCQMLTAPKRLTVQTSHLPSMFLGTVWTWPLTKFPIRGVAIGDLFLGQINSVMKFKALLKRLSENIPE